MRTVMIERFGGPDVLVLRELPDLRTGPGQVRIAVEAAGTNPVDASNRSDGSWAGIELPHVPGYDVAGVVDQVGAGVVGVTVGDRVMAMTPFPRGAGGYAEQVVLHADLVATVPDDVSLMAAAAVPLAGGTAYEVLQRIDLAPGSWVLVNAASGGGGAAFVALSPAPRIPLISPAS